MKYLIDTHIFLWSLFSPEKISRRAAKITKDSKIAAYKDYGLEILPYF